MGSSQYKHSSEDVVAFIAGTHSLEQLKSTKQSCSRPFVNTKATSRLTFLRGINTVYCKFVCRCSLKEQLRKRRSVEVSCRTYNLLTATQMDK